MHAKTSSTQQNEHNWQSRFLLLLPRLKQLASLAFCACDPELREELVAEAIAYCYCAYHRLVERDREDAAHPTVLVRFATKRVGTGLQIGCARNRYDVMSRYSRLQSGIRVDSIHHRCDDGSWQELVLESRSATPADTAAVRVDFGTWIATLSNRDRQIALQLAVGNETHRVAAQFRLSRGRVSQLRRELAQSWYRLHGLDADGREVERAAA